jgi:excisionase family DNA binding protein
MRDTRALATSLEVAEFLQIPPGTLDQYAHRGVGPRFAKIGRHRRYRWADVDAWVDDRSCSGTPSAA